MSEELWEKMLLHRVRSFSLYKKDPKILLTKCWRIYFSKGK